MIQQNIHKLIISWLQEIREIIFNTSEDSIVISTKTHKNDFVTTVDVELEKYLKKQIKRNFPSDSFFGEEGDEVNSLKGRVWIVDPIDGTTNFIKLGRDYTISIALYENGIGLYGYVYDVIRDELFSAEKGKGAKLNGKKLNTLSNKSDLSEVMIISDLHEFQVYPWLWHIFEKSAGHRRLGSAALEICQVASGRIGLFIHEVLSPWDFAAAKIILEEVEGTLSTVDGNDVDMLSKNSILAGYPKVHKTVLSYEKNV